METKRNQIETIFQALSYHKLASIVSIANENLLQSLINVAFRLAIKKSRGDLIGKIYFEIISNEQ